MEYLINLPFPIPVMYMLLTTYPNKPRDLKKFILGLVKG